MNLSISLVLLLDSIINMLTCKAGVALKLTGAEHLMYDQNDLTCICCFCSAHRRIERLATTVYIFVIIKADDTDAKTKCEQTARFPAFGVILMCLLLTDNFLKPFLTIF